MSRWPRAAGAREALLERASVNAEVWVDDADEQADAGDADGKAVNAKNRPKLEFQLKLADAPPCTELQPADISYTLVTQLSTDRLWMMGQHCHRWGLDGPISVVVYTDETPKSIADQMVAQGCRRDQLTVQTLSTKRYAPTEYPVNAMRNMALAAVKTSHVMYADVDFWEAERLRKVLEMDSVKEEFAKDHKLAAVVPAFQIMRQCKEYRDCREENLAKMPNTTEEMMDLVKNAQAGAFDPTNRGGHGSTSYGAWYLQKEGEMYDLLLAAQFKLSRGPLGVEKPLSCSASLLSKIAKLKPRSLDEMAKIIGPKRTDRFGAAFLDVLKNVT